MPDRRKLHEGLRWPRTQSTEREEAWQRLQPVLVTMGLMLHLRHHTQSFTHAISPFFHLYTRLPTTYLKYYTNFYNIHKIYSTYSSVFFFYSMFLFDFVSFSFFFPLSFWIFIALSPLLYVSYYNHLERRVLYIRVCKINIEYTKTFFFFLLLLFENNLKLWKWFTRYLGAKKKKLKNTCLVQNLLIFIIS